ncbi:MAG: GNAT family N-acetyltransferase [Ktedonobacterales bacterium]
MSAAHPWHIRPATDDDRAFLGQLAARLTIGRAAWLDGAAMEAAMRRFLLDDLTAMQQGKEAIALVATAPDSGDPVGAVMVSRSIHFTGEPQAYLGELAVIAQAEGQGVGAALLAAAEAWAREHGARFVVLETGIANSHARAFYAQHGYGEENVKLTKVL